MALYTQQFARWQLCTSGVPIRHYQRSREGIYAS